MKDLLSSAPTMSIPTQSADRDTTAIDPWTYIPFIVFGTVAIVLTAALRLTKQGWVSSGLLGSMIGTGAMLMLRGFQVDPECITVTAVDTAQSTIIIVVGTAVIFHYALFALRDNPRRRVMGCCARDDDIITPIYPPTSITYASLGLGSESDE